MLAPGQLATHMPALHTWFAVHCVPQAPQFALSVVGSTQLPVHRVRPDRQTHAPPTQICSAVQNMEQPPQFLGLVWVLTHEPEHITDPMHEHTPALQTAPCAHTLLQAPQ
jgi:hypothetical protein